MSKFVQRIQVLAMALGAPGIFLVAFLDSSILSLPEVADLLVIWMVTNNKSRVVLYVVSATVGSTLVARTAGMNEASRDAAKRISGAPASTSGSTLLTP